MIKAFLIFHLNLAYSSIPASARMEVVQRCYRPLLDLAANTGIPIGVELPSWTLRRIHELDKDWVNRFRNFLHAGQCELIGSGYTQLIGPLAPYEVNVWNQRLGIEDYETILGTKPRLALVNEMVYSTGLISVYRSAGYDGLVMDRDNVRLALGIEAQSDESVPSMALGTNGESLPVLWSDSILFQKLQRYAHGDISLDDYITYFMSRAAVSVRPLAVYCNDAEVFDYRPGRFREESALKGGGEWKRLQQLLDLIGGREGVHWLSPSEAIRDSMSAAPGPAQILSSITQPVPVKKQAKYNLSRWAVTGRNDLWINTACHRLHRRLLENRQELGTAEHWRTLCELWASDLRTHITPERWQEACRDAEALATTIGVSLPDGSLKAMPVRCFGGGLDGFEFSRDSENIVLKVCTSSIRLALNLRRGLTIHTLGFRSQDFMSVIGTLPHGFFSSIELGADFYSGGVIIELPAEHSRITDLERVDPEIIQTASGLDLVVKIKTECGTLIKTVSVDRQHEQVSLSYRFPGWSKPHAIVRVGMITVLPQTFEAPLALRCANGGSSMEKFVLDRECNHIINASSLVSCTTGFGATTGTIVLGDQRRRLTFTWDPAEAAVFPMLVHRHAYPYPLTRLMFSLSELDETSRPEGIMLPFRLGIAPSTGKLCE